MKLNYCDKKNYAMKMVHGESIDAQYKVKTLMEYPSLLSLCFCETNGCNGSIIDIELRCPINQINHITLSSTNFG